MSHTFKYRILLVLACTAFLCQGFTVATEEQNQTKARYVFRFMSYVTWDDLEESDLLLIHVLGNSDIEGPLIDLSLKRSGVNDQPFKVIHINSVNEIEGCHILLIGEDQKAILDSIFDQVEGKQILTVSDAKGFAASGVNINFFVEEEDVGFEMNIETIEDTGLEVSTQLLKLGVFID